MSSTTIEPPQLPAQLQVLSATERPLTIAMAGNPNAGKTTLFNRLTGLRAKAANFPGTTVDHRRGPMSLQGQPITLLDLPGLYTLDAVTPDEEIAAAALTGKVLPGKLNGLVATRCGVGGGRFHQPRTESLLDQPSVGTEAADRRRIEHDRRGRQTWADVRS